MYSRQHAEHTQLREEKLGGGGEQLCDSSGVEEDVFFHTPNTAEPEHDQKSWCVKYHHWMSVSQKVDPFHLHVVQKVGGMLCHSLCKL